MNESAGLSFPFLVLLASSQASIGRLLAEGLRELGCSVLGPFDTNAAAGRAMAGPSTRRAIDVALLDPLLLDGTAKPTALAARNAGMLVTFFAGYSATRHAIRAENPIAPGPCREVPLGDFLEALGRMRALGGPPILSLVSETDGLTAVRAPRSVLQA
jgi:hypothetical protein